MLAWAANIVAIASSASKERKLLLLSFHAVSERERSPVATRPMARLGIMAVGLKQSCLAMKMSMPAVLRA
jgi:hypothetical protein